MNWSWLTRIRRVALLGASLVAAVPAMAADKPTAAAEISAADAYLNEIKSLKARFIQVAPDGASSEGTLYLLRPGRLRLEYDPPSPVLVVTDGDSLIYYDSQLKQVSRVGLDSTLAGVLVEPNINLNDGKLKVVKISHTPGTTAISVTKRDDPSQGQITLIFTDAPFQLRQWRVVDAQGQATMISLFASEEGMPLDDKLFHFAAPAGVRPRP
jgi:outer membrane lipoprotein-sorting protein